MKKKIPLTIAIVSKNRPHLLDQLLYSLSIQSKNQISVLVIENNSHKTYKSIIKRYSQSLKIKYLLENKPGVAQSRNTAIKNITDRYVCFLDDDCFIDDQWLTNAYRYTKILNRLQYSNISYIIGSAQLKNSHNIFAIVQHLRQDYWLKKHLKNNLLVLDGYVDTKNIILDTKKIKSTFAFVYNKYPQGDISDTDFGLQVYQNGYIGMYANSLIVKHMEASTLGLLIKKAYYRGKNTVYLKNRWHHIEVLSNFKSLFQPNSIKNDLSIFKNLPLIKALICLVLSKVYDLVNVYGYKKETNTISTTR